MISHASATGFRVTGVRRGCARLACVGLTAFGLALTAAAVPAAAAPQADQIDVAVDVSKTGPKIDRHLFGQFA